MRRRDRLGVVTRALFAQRDFTDMSILDQFHESLENSVRGQLTESGMYMGMLFFCERGGKLNLNWIQVLACKARAHSALFAYLILCPGANLSTLSGNAPYFYSRRSCFRKRYAPVLDNQSLFS